LSGVIPPDPHFKGAGGKAKGKVGFEGMEGIEGRKWAGKMKKKGREKEGREHGL
jgi:hypothetical protein